jgi:PAS domain S-box-containing protein
MQASTRKSAFGADFSSLVKVPEIRRAKSVVLRYAVSVLAVFLACALKVYLDPVLKGQSPFLLFFSAVVIAAWFGGLGPGLTAAVIGTSAHFLLFPFEDVSRRAIWMQVGMFLGESAAVTALISTMRQAQRRSDYVALALHESQTSYRRILDTAYEGIWAVNREGQTEYVNNHLLKMLGYTEDEMLKHSPLNFVAPDDIEKARHHLRNRIEGVSAQYELRFIRRDDTTIWTLVSSTPLLGKDGQSQGSLAMLTDITDRKKAEKALEQSEERYRAFIAQSSEAIWRFEMEQPVATDAPEDDQIEQFYQQAYLAECNNAMAQMHGFHFADEITGARLGDLLPRNDDNIAYLRSFVRSGYRLTDAESYEAYKEGETRCFLNNLVGLVEGNTIRRAWGTQRDITEIKEAERERASLLKREQEARREAERSQRLWAFLADASATLVATSDYRENLKKVAHLALRDISDWCAVDLIEEGGELCRLVVAHTNPAKVALGWEMSQRYPTDLDSEEGMARVLREAKPVLYSEVSDELLQAVAHDAEHLRMMREIDMRSMLITPLLSRVEYSERSHLFFPIRAASIKRKICLSLKHWRAVLLWQLTTLICFPNRKPPTAPKTSS